MPSFSQIADYNPQAQATISGWYNNCSLNCIGHVLIEKILHSSDDELAQWNTASFAALCQFLEQFLAYYEIPFFDGNLETPTGLSSFKSFRDVFLIYTHPCDREIILSPVLRKFIATAFKNNVDYRDNFRPLYEMMVSELQGKNSQQRHNRETFNMLEDHPFFHAPKNKQLIDIMSVTHDYFDTTYQNYIEHISTISHRATLGHAELGALAVLFNFTIAMYKQETFKFKRNNYANSEQGIFISCDNFRENTFRSGDIIQWKGLAVSVESYEKTMIFPFNGRWAIKLSQPSTFITKLTADFLGRQAKDTDAIELLRIAKNPSLFNEQIKPNAIATLVNTHQHYNLQLNDQVSAAAHNTLFSTDNCFTAARYSASVDDADIEVKVSAEQQKIQQNDLKNVQQMIAFHLKRWREATLNYALTAQDAALALNLQQEYSTPSENATQTVSVAAIAPKNEKLPAFPSPHPAINKSREPWIFIFGTSAGAGIAFLLQLAPRYQQSLAKLYARLLSLPKKWLQSTSAAALIFKSYLIIHGLALLYYWCSRIFRKTTIQDPPAGPDIQASSTATSSAPPISHNTAESLPAPPLCLIHTKLITHPEAGSEAAKTENSSRPAPHLI